MHIINRIAAFHAEMTDWRRDLHAHPETAFEERRTAALVAQKLRSWGIEVHASYWARLVEAELPRKD